MKERRVGAIVIGASGTLGSAVVNHLDLPSVNTVLLGHQNSTRIVNDQCELLQSRGLSAHSATVDLTNNDSIEEFFSIAVDLFDCLQVVIFCSGHKPHVRQPLQSFSDYDIVQSLTINLVGVILAARRVVSLMESTPCENQNIVFISSEAGSYGGRQITAYAAAKAGINALTKGLARDIGPLNIRVNAISPGLVANSDELTEKVDSNTPIGRKAYPREIADTIFAVVNKLTYINGAIIPISGGR